jgi:hypothetical protein
VVPVGVNQRPPLDGLPLVRRASVAKPRTGTRLRFTADAPLGHLARVNDPDVDENEPTTMERELGSVYNRAALDLHPDTEVTVIDHDEDRGLVLVEWTDQAGNPRITSVDPDAIDQHFTRGK